MSTILCTQTVYRIRKILMVDNMASMNHGSVERTLPAIIR